MSRMAGSDEPASHDSIRVLLANISGVLSELVIELLDQQPDIRIVGQVQDPVDLLVRAGEGVDVLVLGAAELDPPPGICSHLLLKYPDVRIIVLAATGEMALLLWLGLRRRRLRVVSGSTLLAFLRRAYSLNPAE